MKVSAFIRKGKKKNDYTSQATIYFRVRTKEKDLRQASYLTINPNYWNSKTQSYKERIEIVPWKERNDFNRQIHEIKKLIEDEYFVGADDKWLEKLINNYRYPKKQKTNVNQESESEGESELEKSSDLFELFDEFLEKHSLSEVRKKNFRVVKRALMRYELFIKKTKRGMRHYKLNINEITKDTLSDIWNFMEKENEYFYEYPELYESVPEKRAPKMRGKNTLIDSFSRMRTFFIWCYDQGKTTNRPFSKFPLEECLYGSPIYITLEERDKLYSAVFPNDKNGQMLSIQRDIFVFQSVIGCRVSDLYKLTKNNIVNGAVEYIQMKTRNHNPRTIRVPLNEKAKEIIERYQDDNRETLLPFILEQQYNKAIKEAFKLAGLDRIVTILNPLTREPEQKPLYEVVSTHTARKTFIGNMYKKVKDPDLISSVSGHKEGSKAFRRYREIDEDMKKELVHLLD